uniref:Uncharacterized protein n=1 Tax=Yersinia pestis Java 9 TaxID=880632 RepID=E8PST9_YERPE|nr:hypothetical protein YPJ_pCD119 [Yersinia pestis Java 9]
MFQRRTLIRERAFVAKDKGGFALPGLMQMVGNVLRYRDAYRPARVPTRCVVAST